VDDKELLSCICEKGLYKNTAEKREYFKRTKITIANRISELFLAVRNAG
jgi:hypothetical protein